MAIRKRTISPMIWEDPTFNQLSVEARFIFIGMMSNADDEGYLRADSGSIKRLLFGFDNHTKDEIEPWLSELKGFKNVHFYSVNGEWYAHFINWEKYQKQQKDRIQATLYPPCSICVASATHMRTEGKEREEKYAVGFADTLPSPDLEWMDENHPSTSKNVKIQTGGAWANFRRFDRWFAEECHRVKGFRPIGGLKKDYVLFQKRRKELKPEELADGIRFFLEHKKSDEHCTISAALSTDTINLWLKQR